MGTGMLRVARVFVPVIRAILPPEHRIVSERRLDDGDIDMMIAGPSLPETSGKAPFVANLNVRQTDAGEGSTYWAYWTHSPGEEWQVRDPWSKIGADSD